MHNPILPGFAPWLMARGVSSYVAQRVNYLNRNITSAELRQIERDTPVYSNQAAEAIIAAFDFNDTREGASAWHATVRSLRV